jgi:DNA-binding protein H-NS
MSANEMVVGKSLEELMEIQEAAKAEIDNAKGRAVADFETLVSEVKAKAEVLGLNVKSYFVEKKEAPAKYKDPNSDSTWNGRGPNPDWMKALLFNVPKEDWKEARKQYLIA